MPLVTWKDDYSVKVPSIDAQHQKLIDLINTMHDALSSGQGKSVLTQVLTELVAYTRQHFTYEESLMARALYPGLTEHRTLHRDLVQRVTELAARVDTGASTAIETMTFLREWLIDHIQKRDKAYSAAMLSKNIA